MMPRGWPQLKLEDKSQWLLGIQQVAIFLCSHVIVSCVPSLVVIGLCLIVRVLAWGDSLVENNSE
jgi:hypothetical protein